jgi:hypothetical protein
MYFWESVVTIIISGILGFYFGKFKEFRESKQRIYSSILPDIIELCYKPENNKEEKYNSAVILSWIYSNKKVAKQLDKIASILINPERGEITKEVQNLIIEIRKDTQPFPWQRLKVSEVKHIYTRFIKNH